VQSSNEELQSINEELETSKEELQSTNEELTTVNDELQNRNEEITQSNNDLLNVLSGVEIPILLIGNKLQIRRFNASAGKALNLIASDIGRPISDIRPNINVPDLDTSILEVIDSLLIKEQEVQDTQGRWYSMTIRPYKTVDNRIDGAIVTIEDINDLKQGMLHIKEARDYAEAIVETVREHLIVLSKELRVITANQAYYKDFAVSPEKIQDKYFYDIQDGLWNMPKLRQLLDEVIRENSAFNDFEVNYEAPGVGRRIMLLNARRVAREGSELILLAVEDITARRMAEEERDKIHLDHVEALSKVKKLAGMLPICANCKKIRNDKGYWEQIEAYISDHSEAEFSHGICPECAGTLYPGIDMKQDEKK
jgi:two-component system CheB/CheR fusion protein